MESGIRRRDRKLNLVPATDARFAFGHWKGDRIRIRVACALFAAQHSQKALIGIEKQFIWSEPVLLFDSDGFNDIGCDHGNGIIAKHIMSARFGSLPY